MMQMVDGGKFYSQRLKQTFSIFRPELEDRLEDIISGAALLADSSCTRDERRERIVSECNAVRMALQVMSYILLYFWSNKQFTFGPLLANTL